ncbi:MAG: hypothetical protein CVU86_06365 [Firmicutes bacterium HGW-Firmicutes-11]|jgi:hypothetical protein|nr:MAG: hypothetical protein CVU86_06365 [Firmicutes bacterium HGW-Firmicutes-11]
MGNNIKGYHIHNYEKCVCFMESNELTVSKDKEYLGCGMYFWDNHSNAMFWLGERRQQEGNRHRRLCLITCNINIDYMLDLTDNEIVKGIIEAWHEYVIRTGSVEKAPLGYILDTLDTLCSVKPFSVRKGSLHYNGAQNPFADIKWGAKGHYFTVYSRIIYAVKDSEVIRNKRMEEVS